MAGLECSSLELMEGVAREEGYCSKDLLVRVVGWNVKPSPRHVELPICSGVSHQVSGSLTARSDLGINICC